MDNTVLIAAAAAAGALLLLAPLLRNRRTQRPEARPAEALDTLSSWEPSATRVLTAAERKAHAAIARAVPECFVLAQVPLARFIRVPRRRSYTEWLRRVGQLSPDLLVCDNTSQVIAVVEIRPPEEQASPRARERLERMRKVLQAAGIPVHVWSDSSLPGTERIREALMGAGAGPVPTPSTAAPASASRPMPLAAAAPLGAAVPAAAAAAAKVDLMMPIDFDVEVPDEVIEMREPPPSTWFHDLDTSPVAPANPLRASGGIGPR